MTWKLTKDLSQYQIIKIKRDLKLNKIKKKSANLRKRKLSALIVGECDTWLLIALILKTLCMKAMQMTWSYSKFDDCRAKDSYLRKMVIGVHKYRPTTSRFGLVHV